MGTPRRRAVASRLNGLLALGSAGAVAEKKGKTIAFVSSSNSEPWTQLLDLLSPTTGGRVAVAEVFAGTGDVGDGVRQALPRAVTAFTCESCWSLLRLFDSASCRRYNDAEQLHTVPCKTHILVTGPPCGGFSRAGVGSGLAHAESSAC